MHVLSGITLSLVVGRACWGRKVSWLDIEISLSTSIWLRFAFGRDIMNVRNCSCRDSNSDEVVFFIGVDCKGIFLLFVLGAVSGAVVAVSFFRRLLFFLGGV